VLPTEVRAATQAYLGELQRREPYGFGNGRAVRNLFEQMKDRFAERAMSQGDPASVLDDQRFSVADLPTPSS